MSATSCYNKMCGVFVLSQVNFCMALLKTYEPP